MALTFGTYNVGLLKILWHEAVPLAFKRAEILATELPAMAVRQNLDVLALQEVWTKRDAARFRRAFVAEGYVCVEPPRRGWFGSGLLTFVRATLPLLKSEFHPFSGSTGMDRFVQKGVLITVVQPPTGPSIQIANIHLQALTANGSRSLRKQEFHCHRRQVDELNEFIQMESGPMILLGDFNIGPPHSWRLFSRLKKRLRLKDQLEGSDLVTWNQENPLVKRGYLHREKSSRLDHCFTRESENWDWETLHTALELTAHRTELDLNGSRAPLSDHFAVIAQVKLHEKGATASLIAA